MFHVKQIGIIMFFIFDCNDNLVGNAKGYKSVKSAQKIINTKSGKVFNLIWKRFYDKQMIDPKHQKIYSIRPL